jgi:hypothetical protein
VGAESVEWECKAQCGRNAWGVECVGAFLEGNGAASKWLHCSATNTAQPAACATAAHRLLQLQH